MNKTKSFWKKACLLAAVICAAAFTTAGTLSLTAEAGNWWTENAYDSSVYAWDTAAVDANGWTSRVCGDAAWTVGSKENFGIENGYTVFTTAAQGDMFNNTELAMTDGKMISFTYKKENDIDANPDFTFFLVKEVPYKQNRPMRFDADLGGIPVMIQVNGTSAKVTGYDSAAWTGLENGQYHTVNVYLGTGAEGNKSWVSIDGVQKEIGAKRFDYVKRETPTDENSQQLDAWAGWLNIHSEAGCTVEISKPAVTDIVNKSISLSRESVRMTENDTVTLVAEANFATPEGFSWNTSDENVAIVENGVITAVGEGTCEIEVSADGVKQTCSVSVYAYDDPNGWMTTETAGAWGHGVVEESYEYDSETGVSSFITGDCCDMYNKTAFNLAEGPITCKITYAETSSWTLFTLITKEKFVGGSVVKDGNEGPLSIGFEANKISQWGNNWTGEKTDWTNAKAKKQHTVTIYVGTSEEDKSFVSIDGTTYYSEVLREAYKTTVNGQDAYIGYFAIFSAKPMSMDFGAFTRGGVLTLNETEKTMEVGETFDLVAEILPANDQANVVWTSSDATVAKIENGKVTALKPGETIIKAVADGSEAECRITVNQVKATGITLENDTLEIKEGEKGNIVAKFTPANATVGTKFTYTSLNTDIATVNENGEVTAVKEGVAVITVTCGDENQYVATCTVTVTKKSPSEEPGSESKTEEGSETGVDSNSGGASGGSEAASTGSGCLGSVAGMTGLFSVVALAAVALLKKKED